MIRYNETGIATTLGIKPDGTTKADKAGYKRLSSVLRLNPRQLQTLLDTVPLGIWVADDRGRIVMENAQGKVIWGETPQPVESAAEYGVYEGRWPGTGARLRAEDWAMSRALGGEIVVAEEVNIRRFDGSAVTILNNAAPLRNGRGRIVGAVTIAQDITDRKRIEEAVRESEARYRELMMRAPTAIYEIDFRTRRFTSVNDAMCLRTGYSRDELLAMDPSDLLDEPGRATLQARIDSWLRGEPSAEEVEYRVRAKDGREVIALIKATFTTDESGRPIGVMGVGHDITERKRAEEALHESDRQKTRFLAVLSHELRNPLAAIRSGLSILDRVAPGGDQAKRAREIVDRQSGQLTSLVDDLLDLNRITSGKIELRLEPVELTALLAGLVLDKRDTADGFRFEFSPGPSPLVVQADRTRLSQVFDNLLQNAVEFTPAGGEIRVSSALDAERRHVVVRVADTGAGIAPEALPRLFEPFVQSGERDRGSKGLGLGLALVKGLVELHGGEVGVSSPGVGRGAEFTVRLPLHEAPAGDRKTAEAPASPGRRRILLIEDNRDFAESLGDLLEMAGHEVEVALSGAEGLEKARRRPPEVLLCDIGLPDMDGHDIAVAFKADNRLRGVFLVALTGYAQPEDVRRAADAGFDRHLAKPVELETLQRVLMEARGEPSPRP